MQEKEKRLMRLNMQLVQTAGTIGLKVRCQLIAPLHSPYNKNQHPLRRFQHLNSGQLNNYVSRSS